MFCGGSYVLFSSGMRQAWDSPDTGVKENSDRSRSDVGNDGMMMQVTHQ
jgi:hypothetical protein